MKSDNNGTSVATPGRLETTGQGHSQGRGERQEASQENYLFQHDLPTVDTG